MENLGRKTIYTDVETITYQNVTNVLQDAIISHEINANRIDFLLNYEKGEQHLKRIKTQRADIDIVDIDNVANEITTFKTGYHWGNPITIVQRGNLDSGSEDETKAIALLNECYSAAGIKQKTIELARFVEIGGVGYTYIDINNEFEDGESYFTLDVLDPRRTFVVRSSRYPDKRIMLAVSYSVDKAGNKRFTAFTKSERFEIVAGKIQNGTKVVDNWYHDLRSGESNPLNIIPIVEWVRNPDRMGCFERQIPELDSLNILESDVCNATDESVQAIWHCNDVDFPVDVITDEDGNTREVVRKPQNNDWLQTYTTTDGKTPFVTPLHSVFDYAGNLQAIESKRNLILQKCNVPTRNNTSGGSTGVAMSDASGWSQAEVEATMQQSVMEDCKMQEIKIALACIKRSLDIPADSPLLKLRACDVVPNIKRQKHMNLLQKLISLLLCYLMVTTENILQKQRTYLMILTKYGLTVRKLLKNIKLVCGRKKKLLLRVELMRENQMQINLCRI